MQKTDNLKVVKATDEAVLKTIFAIRQEVFVVEQEVEPEEEFDEFEDTSVHFLAYGADGEPAGTARWRFTSGGVKLERFAVRKDYRGQGIGGALVQAVLDDINATPEAAGKRKYMHAQLPAIPLYARFGFEKEGEMFEECNIMHFTMAMPA